MSGTADGGAGRRLPAPAVVLVVVPGCRPRGARIGRPLSLLVLTDLPPPNAAESGRHLFETFAARFPARAPGNRLLVPAVPV
ncbi:hypothetical protein [Streptomyces roseolilacinus]|uniref:hypothetical protein n=1 Tax=Streptomyces roseolilacinus TaxID=66904 RepID=UPI0016758B4D|nr:hypothetical protein [Streptomyces roseolilacinus]